MSSRIFTGDRKPTKSCGFAIPGDLQMTDQATSQPPVNSDWLRQQWTTMLRIRRAEEAISDLVESCEARCPCHLYIGQEAIATGVCAALGIADTVWGGHRSHGHYLAKG